MRMPYKEPQRRTIRLDDDVWDAVKALPCSLNQHLRATLIEGKFTPNIGAAYVMPSSAARPSRPAKSPLLKPSQRRKGVQ